MIYAAPGTRLTENDPSQTKEDGMAALRFRKGTTVVAKNGSRGIVESIEPIKTGLRGRPPLRVTVLTEDGLEEFGVGDLKVVADGVA